MLIQKLHALVKDGVVVHLINATNDFLVETAGTGLYDEAVPLDVPAPGLSIGWTYDSGTGALVAPPIPPAPRLAFDPSGMNDLGGDGPAVGSAPTGAPAS